MQMIFKSVMDGVVLPKPWQPTHMKSYAKGRMPHRIWMRSATNKEAIRIQRAKERKVRKSMDAVLKKMAKETKVSVREMRDYVAAHVDEIFSIK